MAHVGMKAKNQLVELNRRCHRCNGSGEAPCPICFGSGRVLKGRDRLGKPNMERCDGCLGRRTTKCSFCGSVGFV